MFRLGESPIFARSLVAGLLALSACRDDPVVSAPAKPSKQSVAEKDDSAVPDRKIANVRTVDAGQFSGRVLEMHPDNRPAGEFHCSGDVPPEAAELGTWRCSQLDSTGTHVSVQLDSSGVHASVYQINFGVGPRTTVAARFRRKVDSLTALWGTPITCFEQEGSAKFMWRSPARLGLMMFANQSQEPYTVVAIELPIGMPETCLDSLPKS